MSYQNDGGPAFPIELTSPHGGTESYLGMTLRDYFAGQVLAGGIHMNPKDAAHWAYEVADAMLEARKSWR